MKISAVAAFGNIVWAVHVANEVCQEPAVVKAASKARSDVVEAGRSVADLAAETAASWRRISGRMASGTHDPAAA